jgi:hypothetical protein
MEGGAGGGAALVFYVVQGAPGEDVGHPNAFEAALAERPTLSAIKRGFAGKGCGAAEDFHWRFRTAVPGHAGYVWLDAMADDQPVPLSNGAVFAKLLRLDSLACGGGSALPRRAGVSNADAAVKSPASAGSSAAGSGSGSSSGSSAAPAPATERRPSAKPRRPSAAEESDDVHAFFGAAAPMAPTPVRAAAASLGDADDLFGGASASAAAAPAPRAAAPLQRGQSAAAAAAAADDPKLAGMSAAQRAKVLIEQRKENEAREVASKVEEVRQRDSDAAKESEELERVAKELDPKLQAWSGPEGNLKNIRALLSTMHTVLWEGARWEPVTVLVRPIEVKKAFFKACLVVHTDKVDKGAPAEVKHIAKRVFDSLKSQYAVFEQRELKVAAAS